MHLDTVFLRSYRSFHFDYRLKLIQDEKEYPGCKRTWETEPDFDSWRPSIKVPIQHPITSVVGLNESGKSHLIDAVWKAMQGEDFAREDVCRYSDECNLGSMGAPLVGLNWTSLSDDLVGNLNDLVRTNLEPQAAANDESGTESNEAKETATEEPRHSSKAFQSLTILYRGTDKFELMLQSDGAESVEKLIVGTEAFQRIRELLPRAIRVKSNLFLPSSVSLRSLFKLALGSDDSQVQEFLNEFKGMGFFDDLKAYTNHGIDAADKLIYRVLQQCSNLNYQALKDIARASEQLLKEFSSQATERAEELLNLSHWWAQDVDTHLDVVLRNKEVVLNVTDRTGSWYGLAERSQGMRYFLGYLIQVILELKHDNRPLLILSDEPDFALSAVGQRDLLRFFRKLVSYRRQGSTCQVVFTTHSAELIDPNYPNRITILRKGLFDEGTSVVDRAHHGLFEPVRTALGGRGSSLPFIDGPNLLVEGDSDRVFVTRMSQHLASQNRLHLDLAYLSIVIAQGCRRMPGIIVTANSMPGDRAYMTVLLDNDDVGRDTEKNIAHIDADLAKNGQIIRVDAFHEPGIGKDTELEDLVPPKLYLRALREVVKRFQPGIDLSKFPTDDEFAQQVQTTPTVDVVENILNANMDCELDEVFDKSAVFDSAFDMLGRRDCDESMASEFEAQLEKMSGILLEKVNDNLRHKRHDEVRRTMQHLIRSFVHAHGLDPTKARAIEVLEHLRELGIRVSVSGEFDKEIDGVINDHALREGLKSDSVHNRKAFLDALRTLPQRLTIDPSLRLM